MITSHIEILELPNFGYMSASKIQFEWRDKKFVGDVIENFFDVIIFISKYLLFQEGLASSKLQAHLLKPPLKTLEKVQELEIMY